MKIEKFIKKKALPSFCTSNIDVLNTVIFFCKNNNLPCLIESTSNQVNQDGGYSGKTPKQFVNEINKIAKKHNFKKNKLFLGGDHLGPLPWRNNKSKIAIKNSIQLINKCLTANYSKIHIDTSIKCFDDRMIDQNIVFDRTAYILKKSKLKKNLKKVFLVIGTEVPLSGSNDKDKIKITSISQIDEEIKKFRKLLNFFQKKIINFGLVIEPGMRYLHHRITVPKLSQFKNKITISKNRKFVYEAHSTDYQSTNVLKKLVKNNFKFLKVGPELTYSFARSLLFMQKIEKKMFNKNLSNVENIILKFMLKNNKYWKGYYYGKKNKLRKLILNSKLDRMRYYLNNKPILKSIKVLEKNVDSLDKRKLIKYFILAEDKKIFNNLQLKKMSNFNLINFIFISKSLNKYYTACGYRV